MAVAAEDFFVHIDKFMDYRKVVYETSGQTLKSNRTDLKLFREFIENQSYPTIDGPAVMDFQYYLKKDRGNTGGSINRKIFTLRSYSHFLILQDVKDAHDLPFYDVLKVRQGYRNRPNALTIDQVKRLFEGIDRNTCLGIRNYAVYALMYQTGLRVGEVHTLDIPSIDFENQTLEVIGKGNKRRILHLTDEMVQILIEWLAVRNRFYKSNETDALFVSKKGNRLAIRTMEDNIKKIVRNSGIYARFNIMDTLCKLTVYQNVDFKNSAEYDNTLFVPFNDNTNGLYTYGGGRYMDIEIPITDSMQLDFNEAYNPYCAYSSRWSCPLVPFENDLNVSIFAGEKQYK